MGKPSFDILMGTLNGADWIGGQLGSIALQREVSWRLFVSDDGSTDRTLEILDRFCEKHANTTSIVKGPGAGVAANYLSLLRAARPENRFVALSDQDDVWLPARLSRAARFLGDPMDERAKIYASRTWEVVDKIPGAKLSRPFSHKPCFGNALLQNILAGNTVVLNQAALKIVQSASIPDAGVPFHDWWLYALLSGTGAEVVFDQEPTLFYRQHADNVLGAPSGLIAGSRRVVGAFSSEYGQWLRRNTSALMANERFLTPDAKSRLDRFSQALRAPSWRRAQQLKRTGAFRQSRLGNLCVLSAATLGRI